MNVESTNAGGPADRGKDTPKASAAKDLRLVGLTATGPIYRTTTRFDLIPVSCALAYLRELAARVEDPEAVVTSTIARELRGEAAREVWLFESGFVSSLLLRASPAARVAFLGKVLEHLHREKSAFGVEPVVGAALNAAWPWIDPANLERILKRVGAYMARSKYAASNAVPIFDAATSTLTWFPPGQLARTDVEEWLDRRSLGGGGPAGLPQGASPFGGDAFTGDPHASGGLYGPGGLLGPGTPGHKGPDLSGLPGADGKPRGEDDGFGGFGALFGPGGIFGVGGPGVPGSKGVHRSDLPGSDGGPAAEDPYGGFGALLGPGGVFAGLVGRGRLDLSQLANPDAPRNRPSTEAPLYGPGGLLGSSKPGAFGFDLGNLRGSGGPYGAGAALAPGGVEKPEDGTQVDKGTKMAIGGALVGLLGLVIDSPVLVGGGLVVAIVGLSMQLDANKAIKEKHGDKSLYPDPYGDGGGRPNTLPDDDDEGNPTTLWDENGGGGNPTTLWDENGGGGNPVSLWDENGGGGTPLTAPQRVAASVLVGRGLLARVEQIGATTYAL